MGLIGNYSVLLKSCGNYVSGSTISDNRANYNTAGAMKHYFLGAFNQRSAIPIGYATPNAWVLPMKIGFVSVRLLSINNINNANLAGAINISSPLSGSGDLSSAQIKGIAFLISSLNQTSTFTSSIAGSVNVSATLAGTGNLNGALGALVSIVASLNGSGSLNGQIAGALQAIASLSGSGDLQGAITATVSLIASLNGTSSLTSVIIGNWNMVCSILGQNNLTSSIEAKAYLGSNILSSNNLVINNGAVVGSLSANITSLSELSPESLASNVWSALASKYNVAGTMGEKLNGAGSAGNPWTEIIEGTYTAAEVMRLLASVAAGKTTIVDNGDNTATVVFRDLEDTTDRVTATMDGSERTGVAIDV